MAKMKKISEKYHRDTQSGQLLQVQGGMKHVISAFRFYVPFLSYLDNAELLEHLY